MNEPCTITNQYSIIIDETGGVAIDPVLAALLSEEPLKRITIGLQAIQLLRYHPGSTLRSLADELDTTPVSVKNLLNRMGVIFSGRTQRGHWILPDHLKGNGDE